ncbi:hypothetical protein JQC67_14975 [Aurantibacter crassamenti]|uniref:hypothetical protein n=1 Tax=Aurantibacter crassamenti TaxID=1837375 RepID=UPI00193A03DD|nr:hypothetical protein [Aurantibacter crassamenti]MBM1107455.1 hypothetical protein [Aurantibacter crassamenti]
MSTQGEHYDDSTFSGFSNNLDLNGLDNFVKKLERYFFSQVFVRECLTSNTSEVKLVIDVICPLTFSKNVEYFRAATVSDTGYNSSRLLKILSELQEVNNILIDIEEFSLTMEDTTIIVQKIDSLSVARQFDNILRLVLSTYNHIVSQIREVPNEIHIPVLMDNVYQSGTENLLNEFKTKTSDQDYFAYWGLCYDSDLDTIIYDVENSKFIFEDVLFSH